MVKDDILIDAAKKSGLSLSYLYYLSKDLSPNSTAKLCGNVLSLPKKIKSNVMP